MSETAENITTLPAVRKVDRMVVTDVVPIFDTAKFEHMQRIANVMARCALVPAGLKVKDDIDGTMANCFLVVNQAVRWGMDPFAVAQCSSVIQGKLCYEGKLVSAVMQKHGVNLEFDFFEEGKGDALGVIVRGTLPGEQRAREVRGTVAQWKTANDQWKKDPRAMLCYRGARAWSRIHNPAPMLGVYTPDELEELHDDIRAERARPVTPRPPAPEALPPPAETAVVEEKPKEVVAPKPPAPTEEPVEQRAEPKAEVPKSTPMPNPADNITVWLKWLDVKLAAITDGELLEIVWDEKIAPVVDQLFPMDQESAMGIRRRHEERLAP